MMRNKSFYIFVVLVVSLLLLYVTVAIFKDRKPEITDLHEEFNKSTYVEKQLKGLNNRNLNYKFNDDKTRLAVYEATAYEKGTDNVLVAVSVWDTKNKNLINTSTFTETNQVVTNAYLVDMMFSKNNDLLVIGMPTGVNNLTWRYESEGQLSKSCFSYSGTIIKDISQNGELFIAETVDGYKLLCETKKETKIREELFSYQHSVPVDLLKLGNELRLEGFNKNKALLNYKSNIHNSEKTIQELKKKYPFLQFSEIK